MMTNVLERPRSKSKPVEGLEPGYRKFSHSYVRSRINLPREIETIFQEQWDKIKANYFLP